MFSGRIKRVLDELVRQIPGIDGVVGSPTSPPLTLALRAQDIDAQQQLWVRFCLVLFPPLFPECHVEASG